jgi:hypothetical protein
MIVHYEAQENIMKAITSAVHTSLFAPTAVDSQLSRLPLDG